jgi:hypothetical protein
MKPRFLRSRLPILGWTACLAAALLVGACDQDRGPQRLAIAFTGDVWGEIRSCGCATNDLGGLGRRATFLHVFRDTTKADLLLVDAGDFFSSSINYGQEKAELTLKSMALMGYDAIVPGEKDLSFGIDYFRQRVRKNRLPVLAANLVEASNDSLLFPASREVTLRSGLRVGIIGVVGTALKMPPQVAPGSVEIRDPLAAAQSQVDAVRATADVVVVLAHMPRDDARRLSEALKGVDVVINGHDGAALREVKRWGEPYMLQLASKGMYVGVADATLSKNKRVANLTNSMYGLGKQFADEEGVAKLFQAYDIEIVEREKAALTTEAVVSFAGDGACQPCHSAIFEKWKTTPHAHAFERLASQKRDFDRDCTPCHTTGFYKQGGFVNAHTTPQLVNVQCEACHGNGALHAKTPAVKTDMVASTMCRGCHTVDQTPDFAFETFWARIDHGKSPSASGSQ